MTRERESKDKRTRGPASRERVKMASGGEAEKLTAGGKERAVITKVGKRSDLGWESRGWKFTQEELSNPPSLKDNM